MWEFVAGNPVQDLVRAFHNGKAFFENGSVAGHYLHADHLGSARVLVPPFSASVHCRQFFTPFGQQESGCLDSNHRVDFTGKESDNESRFTYFGARYYDPLMGRFLSTDLLLDSADPGDPQTWNRYLYTRNNPTRYTDPDGRAIAMATAGPVFFFSIPVAGQVALGAAAVVGAGYLVYENWEEIGGALDTAGEALKDGYEYVSGGISSAISDLRGLLSFSEEAGEGVDADDASDREGGGRRFQSGEDDLDQLEGVGKAQEAGRGRQRKGPEIHSIEKSKGRVQHRLDRVKNLEDAEREFPEFESNKPKNKK